ncbi:hypothetical protein TNCV_3664011 [Trichonephila clavipes]|nr:hypothetical protein TNCV_3664011 [Trichonephila clavipes]
MRYLYYSTTAAKRRWKDCVEESHSKSEELEINCWEKGRMEKASEEGLQRAVMSMLMMKPTNNVTRTTKNVLR